jgi:hypothetical protein
MAVLAPEGVYNDALALCANLDSNVSDDASSLSSTSDVGLDAEPYKALLPVQDTSTNCETNSVLLDCS